MGQHHVLCHGPIDNISEIQVDERIAWAGLATGGQINISANELFGGESREGGVSGAVDIAMGGPAQGQNSYLVSQLGSDLPAYRGVVSAILRQCYLGNNPYLKPWAYKGQRINVRQDGIAQWYPSRAPIGGLSGSNAIYIALDRSGSMANVTSNGQTRMTNAKASIIGVLDYVGQYLGGNATVDIMIVGWSDSRTSILRRNVNSSGIAALKAYVSGLSTGGGGTDFRQGVADAADFYAGAPADAKRTVLFITDGEPDLSGTSSTTIATQAAATLFATPGIQSFAFNIDLANTTFTAYMDNTPSDGVPVVEGNDPSSLLLSLLGVLGNAVDMNPAHIIRECLTDPDWGLGYADDDIDAESFEAAADQLVIEGLGISLLWDRQMTIEAFVGEIVKHIDAALYVSRDTGRFVLKLIRADFDPDALIHLDESNIVKISNPKTPGFDELTNSVTVQFWDAATGKDASLTVQDTALVQMQGAVIGTTVQYPGFSNNRCASLAAQRDLRSLSFPLFSCTIYTNRIAKDLNIGDTFKLSWGAWRISEMIMRVSAIAFGDGKSSQIRITCVQDVFSTPTVQMTVGGDSEWVDPSRPPTSPEQHIAFEAPYLELVQSIGESQINANLSAKADIGYVMGAATRPEVAINGRIWTDSGGGYQDVGGFDFTPYAELADAIGKTDTALTIENDADLDQVEIGTWVQIGEELMRVDAIDTGAGTLTVGRGVLDTVPAVHDAGAAAYFWDQFAGYDPTEYVEGEEIDVKLQAVSGAGVVPLDSIAADTVQIAARAWRPYPPGNLTINGDSYADEIYEGELTVGWAHRDRLQQTSGTLADHFDGDIGPEAGTVYRVTVYLDDVLDQTIDDIDGTTQAVTPGGAGLVRVEVDSKRDGVFSWQAASHEFYYGGDLRLTEDGDVRATEAGDLRVLEA
ncbi:virion structural protein [Erythrobacter phage vB_EliS_R6L]|nr:virion structural protein [Erythrobacter phage vB_EliS_R6L]